MTTQNIKQNYRNSVEASIKRLCGSDTLAHTLVKKHSDFIDAALERGRPAERLANSIYTNHQAAHNVNRF